MSRVYFASARVKDYRKWWVPEGSMINKLERLFFAAGFDTLFSSGEKVGLKVHMGEPGDVHYPRPIYVTQIVDIIKKLGGDPVIIETSGLGWLAGRVSAKKYLDAAKKNGFCEETVGAPVKMIDGEMGIDGINVKVGIGELEKDVHVAKGIEDLDALIVLSHVTGHIQAGFGGAIKNLGLGLVTKTGKYKVHYQGDLNIDPRKCDGCNKCVTSCPTGSISRAPVEIIQETCVQCNVCLDICDKNAVKAARETSPKELCERIAINAAAVVRFFDKIGYINLLMDIIPHCDCHPHSDIPIVPDIGALASFDPVAIDVAGVDLINKSPAIPGSEAEKIGTSGSMAGKFADKFNLINPGTDWKTQVLTAKALGMGDKKYVLEEI